MADSVRFVHHEAQRPPVTAAVEGGERVSILFVDPAGAELYLPSLRAQFEVTAVSSADQAVRALRVFQPTIVITELTLPDEDGALVCRQAKAFPLNPPSVLAMTAVPESVPEALLAGCDGVLLKPFAPNLLFGRIGLLLKQRAEALRTRAMWQHASSVRHLDSPRRAIEGTNIVWHDASCPSCGHARVVSFDAADRRRLWYACVPCRNVWKGRATQ